MTSFLFHLNVTHFLTAEIQAPLIIAAAYPSCIATFSVKNGEGTDENSLLKDCFSTASYYPLASNNSNLLLFRS